MILGCDPGLTGALALTTDDGDFVKIWDMPISAKIYGKGNEVNAYLLADVVDEAIELSGLSLNAVIERVSAMPGQGVSSMYSFGRSAGALEGVLAARGVGVRFVLPGAWKRHHGLIRKDKDSARTLALGMYPETTELLKRKNDIGRADALLIAAWGAAT